MVAMMAAMAALAENRFYIPDFGIVAGQTATVEMMLDNDVELSALQADITMPDGLAVAMDGDEYVFDLTDRKARNHAISSTLLGSGAIRILVGSQTSKTFTGNSGALVTMEVIAAEDFAGGDIVMRNITVSEADGTMHDLAEETCHVTREEYVPEPLTLDTRLVKLNVGETLQLTVTPSDAAVTWSSSNTSAVTVDASGKMTAVGNGLAEVTATAADGSTATCGVFSELFGDLNGDNDIDVGDVNTVLNIILTK